jgi:hypothetical protein
MRPGSEIPPCDEAILQEEAVSTVCVFYILDVVLGEVCDWREKKMEVVGRRLGFVMFVCVCFLLVVDEDIRNLARCLGVFSAL